MMYVDFTVDNKVYKLRLSIRNTVMLEKQLGCNPLSIFNSGDSMPTITTLVQVLHSSLVQYNHGITLDDTYDIFDKYLQEGNTAIDFISVVLDIFKVSGLIKADPEPLEEDTEKNA